MAAELSPPAHIELAWHLLTVLVRLGRPARSPELAARCALVPAPSPELAELLCCIPGSPLLLTEDHFITVSDSAVAALVRFVSSAIAPFVPRVAVRAKGERRGWGDLSLMYVRKRKMRPLDEELVVPRAKRRLLLASDGDLEELGRIGGVWHQLSLSNGNSSSPAQVHLTVADILAKDILSDGISSIGHTSSSLNQDSTLFLSISNSTGVLSTTRNVDHVGETDVTEKIHDNPQAMIVHELPELCSDKHGFLDIEVDASTPKVITAGRPQIIEPGIGQTFLDRMTDKPVKQLPADMEVYRSTPRAITGVGTHRNKIDNSVLQSNNHREDSCSETPISLDAKNERASAAPIILEANKEWNIHFAETSTLPGDAAGITENPRETGENCHQNEGTSLNNHSFRGENEKSAPADKTNSKLASLASAFAADVTALKVPIKSFEKLKPMEGLAATLGLQNSIVKLKVRRDTNPPKHEQAKRDLFVKQKMKKNHDQYKVAKESRMVAIPETSKSQFEPKLLPNFKSFAIEEEEGSGGYGTVYRARRKEDGKVFAIKCPHANAHSHHINNELKMLERFGGRNFVIKYEGSFKSGDSECFVLEHVEHDRPEVLKKEIDVFELQWYGYCMFRALASLHKQGIVHRDVKPGNFLFSRKHNKGYLIDFNLANDLHQKFFRISKSETSSHVNLDLLSLPSVKSDLYTQARKVTNDGILDNVIKESANDLKKPLQSKNMKKKSNKGHADAFPSIDHKKNYGSQAADVSGVTSAKDATSTRTPSGDRLKQPIPCKGRKELLNFVHEAMQSPNHKAMTVSVSQRKRVAAPVGKLDRRLMMLTPMPLHSGGSAVAGAGMFRNKGNGKQKREGPCVGTKGFRAPEVLFKSCHQGCKVDIWSAGVTLLYLMMGRTPFGGDPEQNIKEIAKLRGSEDLWEVAKLHNCESSFPADLLDIQSLHSMELREWCLRNTRRPEFLELAPPSLFDLVDKCMTVNPRRRITAEEVLMHEFFAPCHDSLRKQRTLRRATG